MKWVRKVDREGKEERENSGQKEEGVWGGGGESRKGGGVEKG